MSKLAKSPIEEPLWSDEKQGHWWDMNSVVRDWLYDKDSLTQRLIAHSDGHFRVQVLKQGWDKPLYSEASLLGIGSNAYIREVLLYCNNKPAVYARTLIPVHSMRGKARHLVMLGNKPLGEVLFADPLTRRQSLQTAKLQPGHVLHQRASLAANKNFDALWGRRTLFLYAASPLLVNEIYLPSLIQV